MKTAKTQTTSNSDVVSGPKYCDGEQTTTDPNGSTDSMRVSTYVLRIGLMVLSKVSFR